MADNYTGKCIARLRIASIGQWSRDTIHLFVLIKPLLLDGADVEGRIRTDRLPYSIPSVIEAVPPSLQLSHCAVPPQIMGSTTLRVLCTGKGTRKQQHADLQIK